jgi:hypothetical protein
MARDEMEIIAFIDAGIKISHLNNGINVYS